VKHTFFGIIQRDFSSSLWLVVEMTGSIRFGITDQIPWLARVSRRVTMQVTAWLGDKSDGVTVVSRTSSRHVGTAAKRGVLPLKSFYTETHSILHFMIFTIYMQIKSYWFSKILNKTLFKFDFFMSCLQF
jgi:hypothetical protein